MMNTQTGKRGKNYRCHGSTKGEMHNTIRGKILRTEKKA